MSRRICFVSFSSLADDPRVLRHAAAAKAAGWTPTLLGYSSAGGRQPPYDHVAIPKPVPTTPWRLKNAAGLLLARLGESAADVGFFLNPERRALLDAARGVTADLFIANDWNTLPIAARLAQQCGARFLYDSHEYCAGEHAERWKWRLIYPPAIRAIERRALRQAAAVMTVSEPIARQLQDDYALPTIPAVIRNVPPYRAMPFRAPGDVMTVLFHGALAPGRGLEPLIDSVPLWQDRFRLVIRGTVAPAYDAFLRARAAAHGVSHRIEFAPPVTVEDLVPAANQADIGIHCLPGVSLENRFALPNKMFEYIGAGLALCINDLPAMAAVVTQYAVGTLIDGPIPTPESIARAVNGLTQSDVARYKANSLTAARDLSWDQEQKRFLDLVEVVAEKRAT